jgi:hypothetical protein
MQEPEDRRQRTEWNCGLRIATQSPRGEQVLMGSNNKFYQIFRKSGFSDKSCMLIAYSKGSHCALGLVLLLSSLKKGHQFSSAMSY